MLAERSLTQLNGGKKEKKRSTWWYSINIMSFKEKKTEWSIKITRATCVGKLPQAICLSPRWFPFLVSPQISCTQVNMDCRGITARMWQRRPHLESNPLRLGLLERGTSISTLIHLAFPHSLICKPEPSFSFCSQTKTYEAICSLSLLLLMFSSDRMIPGRNPTQPRNVKKRENIVK